MTDQEAQALLAASRARRAELAGLAASKVKGMAARARVTLASEGDGLAAEWPETGDHFLPRLVAAASLDGQPVTLAGRTLEVAR